MDEELRDAIEVLAEGNSNYNKLSIKQKFLILETLI